MEKNRFHSRAWALCAGLGVAAASVITPAAQATEESAPPSGVGYLNALGRNSGGGLDVPLDLGQIKDVAATDEAVLAVKTDGTVRSWGKHGGGVPPNLSGVKRVAVGFNVAMALKDDGTVVAWGAGNKTNPIPGDLSGVTDIAIYLNQAYVVKDGEVKNYLAGYPAPEGVKNVEKISAGANSVLARTADGSVTSWGANKCQDPAQPITDAVDIAISSGSFTSHCMAVKKGGTVVTWGRTALPVPTGLTDVAQVDAANISNFSALKNDKRVVTWGNRTVSPSYGEDYVPDFIQSKVERVYGFATERFYLTPLPPTQTSVGASQNPNEALKFAASFRFPNSDRNGAVRFVYKESSLKEPKDVPGCAIVPVTAEKVECTPDLKQIPKGKHYVSAVYAGSGSLGPSQSPFEEFTVR